MKIIHISDLHYPKHNGAERLIDKIIDHYREEEKKPIVVCSGDILDTPPINNNDDNYISTKNILSKFDANGFKLLICPGNHDLKKNGVKKRKRINFNLKRFSKHFSSLLPVNSNVHGELKNNLLSFPLVHKFDDHFFIGLNSMNYQPKSAKGNLGDEQRKKLKSDLLNIRQNNPNPTIIVYLHHNPVPFNIDVIGVPDFGDRIIRNNLRLEDRAKFLKIVKGVNVLLFGHLHWNKRHEKDEEKYSINCIQLTGGSTVKNEETWTEIDTSDYTSKDIVL